MFSSDTKRIFSRLIPLLLLLTGLYLVPIQIYETDFSKVPGDYGDARFNNYILEHGHKFLTGQIDKYWDAPFLYPYSNAIAFSDNLLGSLPIYSAFRLLHFDRETSYQLWLLVLFALNFICSYWVLKKWSVGILLASTGAYIYAFSILLVSNIYNVQTYPRFITPFVFYWVWKYLSTKQLKYFLFSSLGMVYQFYCGIYLGFFLAYTILFLFIGYMTVYRDTSLFLQFKNLKKLVFHLLIIVIAGALMIPLMQPYIEIADKMGMRKFQEVLPTVPTLLSYFFTSTAPVIWSFMSEWGKSLPYWWCHFLFIGALPWIGILCIPVVMISRKIKSDRKKFVAFLTVSFLLTFLFCLNIKGFTLYEIIFHLPGFASMRGINRVINTEVMDFILIFVFVFYELSKHYPVFKRVLYLLPVLVILDNAIYPKEIMRYDKAESQQQIAAVKENIKKQYNKKYAAIVYTPIFLQGDEVKLHLNVMLACQELNIPCVNAYTGSYPENYPFYKYYDEAGLSTWCKANHIDKNNIQQIRVDNEDFGRKIESSKRIHLKGYNGKFVCADESLNNLLVVNRSVAQGWETFTLLGLANSQCALFASNNHFVTVELDQQGELTATRGTINDWEIFTLIPTDSNHVALKAANGKYLSIDSSTLYLLANADSMGNREKFEWIEVHDN